MSGGWTEILKHKSWIQGFGSRYHYPVIYLLDVTPVYKTVKVAADTTCVADSA